VLNEEVREFWRLAFPWAVIWEALLPALAMISADRSGVGFYVMGGQELESWASQAETA
jgi:hypothetical protein